MKNYVYAVIYETSDACSPYTCSIWTDKQAAIKEADKLNEEARISQKRYGNSFYLKEYSVEEVELNQAATGQTRKENKMDKRS